ncbi:MAG: DMT family transporter [Pseudomonadota bacterium]
MSNAIATDRRANFVGSVLMIAAMAAFACEDVFVKAASATLPVGQILVMFGTGGAVVFASITLWRGQPLWSPDVLSPPMRVRVVFEILGRLFYTVAIATIPLSAATVILQATPLVVVVGAALIFGETVGWRRWTAILIGLLGVVIVIQPGAEAFSVLSLLAVVGMLGFAGRDLASRAAPASISTTLLGLYGFLAVIVAGVLFAIWDGKAFVMPDALAAGAMAGAVLAGATAYVCLMRAMRTGEISAVTPFRYTRLLFGIALGMAVYGEPLTWPMVAGSCLIVVSGLFILWRSTRR